MKSRKPSILLPSPFSPSLAHPPQILHRTLSPLRRRLRKGTRNNSIRPKSTPPFNLLITSKTPHTRTRRNFLLLVPCLAGPGMELSTSIGFAAIGARDANVRLFPFGHAGDFGEVGEGCVIGIAGCD